MNRAEHMAWCKQRALEYVDAGKNVEAVTSMVSDLRKHDETRDHAAIALVIPLMAIGEFDSHQTERTRRFIEGFN